MSSARTVKPRAKPPTKDSTGNLKLKPRSSIIMASKANKQTIFSNAMTDNTLLDPTTQAQISASIPSTPDTERPIRLTIISADALEALRTNNRILRSNNISIMKQMREAEEKLAAAEEEVEELKMAMKGK
jgi:hypothetical protein